MEGLSGNSSDRNSLLTSIQRFSDSLSTAPPPLFWVADSALYSADNIRSLQDVGHWITRVPEMIKAVNTWKSCT